MEDTRSGIRPRQGPCYCKTSRLFTSLPAPGDQAPAPLAFKIGILAKFAKIAPRKQFLDVFRTACPCFPILHPANIAPIALDD